MAWIIGPSGIVMDIEDIVASGLVDGGHARYVTESPAETDEPQDSESEGTDDESGETSDVDEVPEGVTESPAEMPKGNASLEEWAAFATPLGKDVAGLSRDEIRALFKE